MSQSIADEDDTFTGMPSIVYDAYVRFLTTGEFPSFVATGSRHTWKVNASHFTVEQGLFLKNKDRLVLKKGETQRILTDLHIRLGHADKLAMQIISTIFTYGGHRYGSIAADAKMVVKLCPLCRVYGSALYPRRSEMWAGVRLKAHLKPDSNSFEVEIEGMNKEKVDAHNEELYLRNIEELEDEIFCHRRTDVTLEDYAEIASFVADKAEDKENGKTPTFLKRCAHFSLCPKDNKTLRWKKLDGKPILICTEEVKELMKRTHEMLGHAGRAKIISTIRHDVYWKGMQNNFGTLKCDGCMNRNGTRKESPLTEDSRLSFHVVYHPDGKRDIEVGWGNVNRKRIEAYSKSVIEYCKDRNSRCVIPVYGLLKLDPQTPSCSSKSRKVAAGSKKRKRVHSPSPSPSRSSSPSPSPSPQATPISNDRQKNDVDDVENSGLRRSSRAPRKSFVLKCKDFQRDGSPEWDSHGYNRAMYQKRKRTKNNPKQLVESKKREWRDKETSRNYAVDAPLAIKTKELIKREEEEIAEKEENIREHRQSEEAVVERGIENQSITPPPVTICSKPCNGLLPDTSMAKMEIKEEGFGIGAVGKQTLPVPVPVSVPVLPAAIPAKQVVNVPIPCCEQPISQVLYNHIRKFLSTGVVESDLPLPLTSFRSLCTLFTLSSDDVIRWKLIDRRPRLIPEDSVRNLLETVHQRLVHVNVDKMLSILNRCSVYWSGMMVDVLKYKCCLCEKMRDRGMEVAQWGRPVDENLVVEIVIRRDGFHFEVQAGDVNPEWIQAFNYKLALKVEED